MKYFQFIRSGCALPPLGWTKNKRKHKLNHVPGLTHGLDQKSEPGDNLLATFQIELGADVVTVRETLERIAGKYPNLPVAEISQRRLELLNNEFRGRQKATVVKLGVYEQNIGLRCGLPR